MKKTKNIRLFQFLKLGLVFLIWLITFIIAAQVFFIFFSQSVIKPVIQDKVYTISNGLYKIDFEDISVNFLQKNLYLTKVKIIPDTSLYSKFVEQNNFKKPVYEINFDSLIVTNLKIIDLLKRSRKLKVEEIKLVKPYLKLITLEKNSEETKRKNEFEVASKDLLPLMFRFFTALEIDRIILENGFFDFLIHKSENKETFSADNITLILNDFDITRENFLEKEKVLYTNDVELKIEGYKLKLKDKIHILTSSNIYISTKHKIISLDNAQLTPNQLDTFSLDTISENYFNISIPKIELANADFENLYLNKIIDLQNIEINDAEIRLFKKKTEIDTLKTKIDFFKLINGNLEYLNIDTLKISDAQLSVFDNITEIYPRTNIGGFTLKFYNFKINESSSNALDKILGAENVYLEIKNFSHKLKDNIHSLSAENLILNSENKTIDATNVSLLPENNIFSYILYQNVNKIIVPSIALQGVDIVRFYNYYELNIENFIISNPSLNIMTYNSENKKIKRGGNNFQDNLSGLTKEYLKGININNLILNSGSFSFQKFSEKKNTLTSGNIDVTLNLFSFNPNLQITRLFSAENIEVLFTDYKLKVPESFHQLSIDSFEISTFKEGLFFSDIKIEPIENNNLIAEMSDKNKSLLLNIQIPELQILETNLHTSILEDSLKIKNIDIPEATFEITVLTGDKQKTQKLKNIQNLRNNAVTKINNIAEESKIETFLNFNLLDSLSLGVINQKKNIIDSIRNFSVSSIKNMIINPKHIKLDDSTYQPLTDIENIAETSINALKYEKLTAYQIDSLFNFSINKILYINNSIDKNIIEREEVYELVGSFLNIIDIDELSLENGVLIFNNYINEEKNELFHNSFSINMYDFYFNYDSISTSDRFLFSKNIDVKIEDYILNLKDNIHKVLIKEVELSTEKSEIVLNSISISPFTSLSTKNANKIYAFCPKAVLTNINLIELYENKTLEIQNCYIKKPLVTFIKNESIKNDSAIHSKLTQVLLPSSIKSLIIENIEIDTGKIKFLDSKNLKEKTVFQSDFNVDIHKFMIDSVSYVSNNPFLIPIENIEVTLFDFKFNLKDKIHFIKADEIVFKSDGSKMSSKNLKLTYNKSDTSIVSTLISNNKFTLFDLLLPEFELENIDLDILRKNKEIILKDIKITNPEINIHSYSYLNKSENKKIRIEDVDLYVLIKPLLNKFQSEKISFSNTKLCYYSHKKDITDSILLNNVSGDISGLVIDSLAADEKGNFLFADNIYLKISNFEKLISDSLYTFKSVALEIYTKKSEIIITDFEIAPNYDKLKFSEELFGYQKSVMTISGRKINIQKFDILNFLNNKKLISQKIIAEGIDLNFYKDMNPLFNDTLQPVNPMDILRNSKKYINIDTILIINSKLVYEQLSANKAQTGILTLDKINGYILNLTNDSVKIAENTAVVMDFYTMLMGTGNTHLNINLPINSIDNFHKIEGSIENMNMSDLNDFTTNAFSASINNGFINKLTFKIIGNDSISNCVMRINYDNLEVNVLEIDTAQQIQKRKFLSFIINKAVIRQNNPKWGVFFQKGDVIFLHDNRRQFIYNWLQPLIKAITASVAGSETANMVENILAKVQIKNQRRKEEKLQEKMLENKEK